MYQPLFQQLPESWVDRFRLLERYALTWCDMTMLAPPSGYARELAAAEARLGAPLPAALRMYFEAGFYDWLITYSRKNEWAAPGDLRFDEQTGSVTLIKFAGIDTIAFSIDPEQLAHPDPLVVEHVTRAMFPDSPRQWESAPIPLTAFLIREALLSADNLVEKPTEPGALRRLIYVGGLKKPLNRALRERLSPCDVAPVRGIDFIGIYEGEGIIYTESKSAETYGFYAVLSGQTEARLAEVMSWLPQSVEERKRGEKPKRKKRTRRRRTREADDDDYFGMDDIEKNEFGSLTTRLRHCSSLPPKGGARQAMNVLQDLGATSVEYGDRASSSPYDRIERNGNIIVPLSLDCAYLNSVSPSLPDVDRASIQFLQETRELSIHNPPRVAILDSIYHAHLKFARILYPLLRPEFGSIDVTRLYLRASKEQESAPCPLPFIYWANIFGPAYVQHYGRDFLLAAPGWEIEQLDDGGILYVTTESYLPWWDGDQAAIVHYFGTKSPDVRLYRAKEMKEALAAKTSDPRST